MQAKQPIKVAQMMQPPEAPDQQATPSASQGSFAAKNANESSNPEAAAAVAAKNGGDIILNIYQFNIQNDDSMPRSHKNKGMQTRKRNCARKPPNLYKPNGIPTQADKQYNTQRIN